jgi:hypothetical protein
VIAPAFSSRAALGASGAAAGGAGAALLAALGSACCATPALAALTVSLLGASGAAWAAGFEPYAGWMLALALLALGFGYGMVRRAARACESVGCATPRAVRFARATLLVSAAIWFAAAALRFVRWAPQLFGGS